MKKKIIIIFAICLYFVSALYNYNWFNKACSGVGIYPTEKYGVIETCFTLLPVYNTVFACINLTKDPLSHYHSKDIEVLEAQAI